MQYTHLGRTGLMVSRFCLGTMNFGPHTTEADSFAIMDKALELGINFFDTANVYGWKKGEGITEQIIGRWLAQRPGRRESIVLATKVYGDMGPAKFDRGRWVGNTRGNSWRSHGSGVGGSSLVGFDVSGKPAEAARAQHLWQRSRTFVCFGANCRGED